MKRAILRERLSNAVNQTLVYLVTLGYEIPDDLKTYDAFRRRLWDACNRLFNGGKESRFESTFLRSIDQQLTEAWNRGAEDVGVMPDEMTPDDLVILNAIIDSEFNYSAGLEADIIAARDGGMAKEDFASKFSSRIDLWANRYNETENRARMQFGQKARLQWQMGATEQHCGTCSALNGIVAFGYEWEQSRFHPQMPPNSLLDCEGWKCECMLTPTTQRRSPRAFNTLIDEFFVLVAELELRLCPDAKIIFA